MSKYINADEFLQKVQEHHYILRSFDNSKDFGMFDCGIKRVVDEMPAADVAEVVRCKDCKYAMPEGRENVYICKAMTNPSYCLADDYCSCGERKETDERK